MKESEMTLAVQSIDKFERHAVEHDYTVWTLGGVDGVELDASTG